MSGNDMHVIVIGGGLVGSLASLYFAKNGNKVTMIEKRRDMRKVEMGWLYPNQGAGRSINLALSVRGMESLAKVGISITDKIPMKGRMIHSENKLMSQDYGVNKECIYSVDRKMINQVLLQKCEEFGVEMLFETQLERVNDFENGVVTVIGDDKKTTTISGDLIIGADGAYSRLRTQMMRHIRMSYAQEYIDHGYVELSMPPINGDYAMDPNHLHIWPRKSFMMIALPNMDKSFTVTLFMPFMTFESIKTREDLLDFFKKYFDDAVDKIGVDLLVNDYFSNPKGSLISIKNSPYNIGGRFVILGDAAHAMVPFYGQGMNCGFEDVLVLAEMLEEYQSRDINTMQKVLTRFSDYRSVDAMAMCDLALHNYIEMRSDVLSSTYLIRKKMESILTRFFPSHIIPLYTMVSFSRIRYSVALERYKKQTVWFESFIGAVKWGSLAGLILGGYGVLKWRKMV